MSINKTQILLAILLYVTAIFVNNFTIEPNILTIETGRPRLILYFVILFILFFSLLLILQRKKIILPSRTISIILLIGFFFSTINSVIINDLRPIINYGVLYIIIFGIINFYAYTNSPLNNIKKIIFGIVTVNILFLIGCVLFEPFTIYRYNGIFDHSNSAGRVLGCIFIVLMAFLIFFKKNIVQNFLVIIFILLSLMLLIATNSRTPLAISFLSVILLLFIDSIKNNRNFFRYINFSNFFKYIFLLLPFLIIFYILNFYVDSGNDIFPTLYENFKYQFERYPGSYGTSDRIIRWENAINEYYSFFGSAEYNNLSYSKLEVHNNYLSQTLKFGLIPAISFHLIPLIIFFKSLKRVTKYKTNEAIVPLILSFYLILYYIFETSSLITPFWVLIFLEGLFLAEDCKKSIKKKNNQDL